jgi:hypothetical protein
VLAGNIMFAGQVLSMPADGYRYVLEGSAS